MNNKGFTMVELLVAMAILALLTVMAFPTLRSISVANSNKKIEAYGDSLVSAAKLYTDNYKEDMFSDDDIASYVVSFESLYKNNLIKDINEKDISCKNSNVVVAKNGDNYLYCLDLDCDSKSVPLKYNFENSTECNNYSMVKLTYHSNNGKNQVSIDKQVKGDSFSIKNNPFKKDGYTFASWNIKKDGSGSIFLPGVSNKFSNNSDLHAQWCMNCKKDSSNILDCKLSVKDGKCDYSESSCVPSNAYKLTGKNPSDFKCEPIEITCNPGYYIKAGSITCNTECTSGNYCPGGKFKYNPKNDEGKNKCPNGYGNSQVKSSKDSNCFMKVSANYHVAKAKDEKSTGCSTGRTSEAHNVYYNNTSSCDKKVITVYFHRNFGSGDTTVISEKFTYGDDNQKFGLKYVGTIDGEDNLDYEDKGFVSKYEGYDDNEFGFGPWIISGYRFLGWSKSSTDTTVKYSPNSSVSNDWINTNSPSIDLYGIWQKNNSNTCYSQKLNIDFSTGKFSDSLKFNLKSRISMYFDIKVSGKTDNLDGYICYFHPGQNSYRKAECENIGARIKDSYFKPADKYSKYPYLNVRKDNDGYSGGFIQKIKDTDSEVVYRFFRSSECAYIYVENQDNANEGKGKCGQRAVYCYKNTYYDGGCKVKSGRVKFTVKSNFLYPEKVPDSAKEKCYDSEGVLKFEKYKSNGAICLENGGKFKAKDGTNLNCVGYNKAI